ncbi:MAG: hypothetical protein IKQ39_07975 [Oscillospiraceae bacterium]|nr:hypothetical protein [Oscillospiraceae bacterium]
MEKQKHTVRLMLNIGLILQILRTVLEIAVYMFPKQALQLMNYNYPEGIAKALETKPDLTVLLMPLLPLGAVLLLYFLLRKQTEQTTGACSLLMILTVITPLLLSLVSIPVNSLVAQHIVGFNSLETLAAFNMVRSAAAPVSMVSAPVIPLFAASAGALWFRSQEGRSEI